MCAICQRFNPFSSEWLHDGGTDYAEAKDAPAGKGTSISMSAGQTIAGTLSEGDEDWIKLKVTTGETFVITTGDGASNAVKDTLLVLYDRNGKEVALNDDEGPGFHAQISYEAKDSVYYAAVTTYQAHYGYPTKDSGDYTLTLSGPGGPGTGSGDGRGDDLPTYSNRQIAEQLIKGYWQDTGRDQRGFDISVSDGRNAKIYIDTSGLTEKGRWYAEQAFEVWSSVTGIKFSDAEPPKGRTVGILLDDENSGAYSSTTLYDDGSTANVFINISRGWITGEREQHDSYGLQTFVHEIGHALGLGHAGVYNVGDGVSITYADHAEYANDSWQTSVMSYFSQEENTHVDSTRAYLLTPTAADILAIQMLYGTAGDLRKGDTIYGDGSTAGDYYDHMEDHWGDMAFTILDDGGKDTLSFGSATHDQNIYLKAERFSDVGGEVGNMTIAKGTVIENAISGSGDDRVSGNSARNRLEGGAGKDTLDGQGGRDVLKGDGGRDLLKGGKGADKLNGGTGSDRLLGDTGNDKLLGGNGRDKLDGGAGNDNLKGGNGADTFIFGPGDGRDTITDWQDGVDRIDLSDWGFRKFGDVADLASEKGGDLVFNFDDGSRLTILGLDGDDFGSSDVLI